MSTEPDRAWWSVALLDMVVVLVVVTLARTYGWGAALVVAVVGLVFGLWWRLRPFWTRAQRDRLRRRTQQPWQRQE